MKKISVASAPATVANVNAGFDILGFSLPGISDQVRAWVIAEPVVRIKEIVGVDIPSIPAKNTASVALQEMIKGEKLTHGFEIVIEKGIPLASGLGGSAASAVAAVVAGNQLLKKKLSLEKLFFYALKGEEVASGGIHGDNIAPALYGGITACLKTSDGAFQIVPIRCPKKIFCSIFHPAFPLETKKARGILKTEISLKDYIQQSMHLTGLLMGFNLGDYELIYHHAKDIIITPQRKSLLPFYDLFYPALIKAQSLAFGISGAGPSIFILSKNLPAAKKMSALLTSLSHKHKVSGQVFTGQVGAGKPEVTILKVRE
ncbi:MAG: homoserine kinase [Bdellovibrionales bacterium GWA2_49_15]|nr:MAG: homoserine kinase [Bdellovibrionales bacterium GWA2_49_15]HAZ14789.1 homoserine kinase [Bdellovibrionales bacterium]